MSDTIFALTLDTLGKGLIYIALALAILRLLPTGVLREASFTVVTCLGFYAIFFHSDSGVDLRDLGGFGGFVIYLVFGVLHCGYCRGAFCIMPSPDGVTTCSSSSTGASRLS